MLVKFKRNYTVKLFEDTNFYSGEFTFRRGVSYNATWLSNNHIVITYGDIIVDFICSDIDKYLDV